MTCDEETHPSASSSEPRFSEIMHIHPDLAARLGLPPQKYSVDTPFLTSPGRSVDLRHHLESKHRREIDDLRDQLRGNRLAVLRSAKEKGRAVIDGWYIGVHYMWLPFDAAEAEAAYTVVMELREHGRQQSSLTNPPPPLPTSVQALADLYLDWPTHVRELRRDGLKAESWLEGFAAGLLFAWEEVERLLDTDTDDDPEVSIEGQTDERI